MPTLDWIGKKHVVNLDRQLPYRMIHCENNLSVGDAGEGNLLIEGDNLQALKALLPYYKGSVKCVYIDPPYNTTNKDWKYKDNVSAPETKEWIGVEVGGPDDFTRHDKWLCMMYPRLKLLRELLREDGVIYVSIGFQEVAHLRCMMNEIFGAENFIAQVAWQKVYSPRMDAHNFSDDVDYIIVYARSEATKIGQVKFEQNQKQFNVKDDVTGEQYRRRSWRKEGKNSARSDRPNLFYKLMSPDGTGIYPIRSNGSEGCWRGNEAYYQNLQASGQIEWIKANGDWQVYVKQVYDTEASRPPSTLWQHTEVGHNHEASEEVKQLFGHLAFDTPKPSRLIKHILRISTGVASSDLILDSFSGSGVSGDAVMQLNAEDGGNRRFILVEMEPDICRPITAQRLKRVIEANGGGLLPQGGFRFCTLKEELFDAEGRIHPNVTFSDLAHHIFFTETGEPIPHRADPVSSLIGCLNGTAYYLLWHSPTQETILSLDTVRELPPHDGPKIVYADGCELAPERLARVGVTFKQIPYDVTVR